MVGIRERLSCQPEEKLLIYGIGNLGRQDDGLGIRLLDRLAETALPAGVTLEANYQLSIEDALLIAEFDAVLFIDATVDKDAPAPFSLRPLAPAAEVTFSTHSTSPAGVLSPCAELYGRRPRAFLLALPGYEWELREELSALAQRNLEQTCRALLIGESHA